MAQPVIPDADHALQERLRARASRNGRTLEAEVCATLEQAEPEAPEQAFREDGAPGLGTEQHFEEGVRRLWSGTPRRFVDFER